jgi:hypothetical protein
MNMRPVGLEPDPIELDPRPCDRCCLTIERHERVDTPEGPEFFCLDLLPDEMTLPELERRAELRGQEEIAWIVAQMETVEPPYEPPPLAKPPPYRTAAATIDAFWYVVGLDDPECLKLWLLDHPRDAATLHELLESK